MGNAVTLVPYDHEVSEEVFSALFCNIGPEAFETEDGLGEIPAASYQLVVSALEMMRWEVHGEDLKVLRRAAGIVEQLRDKQKRREWNRKYSG